MGVVRGVRGGVCGVVAGLALAGVMAAAGGCAGGFVGGVELAEWQPEGSAPPARPEARPAVRPGQVERVEAREPVAPSAEEVDAAVARGVELLLSMQSGDGRREWPYEGVYRVQGQIPIAYRIGGTAIVASALVRAPGYAEDKPRQEAVARAVEFVCAGVNEPLMSEKDYTGGYDVRAWGYVYGLDLLARMKMMNILPEAQRETALAAAAWYLDALQKVEMPGTGGWSYSRQRGRETVGPPSPFMTAAAMQALYVARRAGMPVDEGVLQRGLSALERSRNEAGVVVYAGFAEGRAGRTDQTPGATGRMPIVATTLALAGRGSVMEVRGSVDAFIVHWEWLDARRGRTGTHEGPYGVAPYYFMWAHTYVAQAIELLPPRERAEYRRRVNALLFSVRGEDGGWNDRVFERSKAYGTAMAMLALLAAKEGAPPGYIAEGQAPEAVGAPAAGGATGGAGG